MLSLAVGTITYPLVVARAIYKGWQEMQDVTAALNHFATCDDDEWPDSILDMLTWKPVS